MNLLPLCIAVVILAAVFYAACVLADDTVIVQPEPEQPHHTCHVRHCGRLAYFTVTRRDTGATEWVCVGCWNEGTAWGYWADEVTL